MKPLNKHGQSIGRKGAESRRRLLDAARALIATEPAHKIGASAIARAARLASQTFYLYFADIDEVLVTLSEEAGADMAEVMATLHTPWREASPADHARRFVESYSRYWDRHRAILSIRNYRADNGHAAFLELRQDAAIPIVTAIAELITAAHAGEEEPRAAFARAVIIYSAIERMAARPATLSHRPVMIDTGDIARAEIEILTLLFTPAATTGTTMTVTT